MRWKKCGAPSSTRPLPKSPSRTPTPARPSWTELHLIAVGRLREGAKTGPEAELFARYAARLRPRLSVIEIAEAPGPPHEAKRRENAALRAAIPPKAYAVALDLGGAAPDSENFALALRRWQAQQAPLCFLIGGAEGLDEATLAQVSATVSLGPMTWPHMLARVMLVEQLYRAQTIMVGHPYHRAGRPG